MIFWGIPKSIPFHPKEYLRKLKDVKGGQYTPVGIKDI